MKLLFCDVGCVSVPLQVLESQYLLLTMVAVTLLTLFAVTLLTVMMLLEMGWVPLEGVPTLPGRRLPFLRTTLLGSPGCGTQLRSQPVWA